MTDELASDTGLAHYAPGDLVRHPDQDGWGIGQVQSAIGNRVTVNFQHAGKQTMDVGVIRLEVVDAPIE